MTGRGDVYANLDHEVKGSVKFGDGSVDDIQGISIVVFSGKHGEHKALRGVYYIPRLKNSIISVDQLDEGGSRVEVKHGVLRIWECEHRLLARVEQRKNKLYERLGHVNFDAISKMARQDMVRGLPFLEHVDQFCDTCVLSKHRRGAFPKQAKRVAPRKAEAGCPRGPLRPRHAAHAGRPAILPTVDGRRHSLHVGGAPGGQVRRRRGDQEDPS
ncbi:hypothetical protein U9M48_019565 [Paspalum notatum var. saurae]|uniref:GAG-pre-integrase domain-containing protein n=1 Tax=Paspalum notatum var. saurae TaxID=547442 RepID=A0AAQ3TDE3_PASNO